MTSIELDDRTTFEALAARHRRELQLHCYRILGSLDESEDLVQETWSMPPEPGLWRGRDAIVAAWVDGGMGTAVACYLKRPGEDEYRALALEVLRIEAGEIADITAFTSAVFAAFGLPEKL